MSIPSFLYHFWFERAHMSQSGHPEFVFTVPKEVYVKFNEVLNTLITLQFATDHIESYLVGAVSKFAGEGESFGLRWSGYEKKIGGDYEFHIMVREDEDSIIALSIWMVMYVFHHLEGTLDTRTLPDQHLTFHTHCAGEMNGHGVYGRVYSKLGRWLVANAGQDCIQVTDAMREVWKVVAQPPLRRYAGHSVFFLRDNGSFSLQCFGDACDLSVYPDSIEAGGFNGRGSAELGCHNLDSAPQQLTLLAGLATLSQMAT